MMWWHGMTADDMRAASAADDVRAAPSEPADKQISPGRKETDSTETTDEYDAEPTADDPVPPCEKAPLSKPVMFEIGPPVSPQTPYRRNDVKSAAHSLKLEAEGAEPRAAAKSATKAARADRGRRKTHDVLECAL
jgi:hypothetical protein